MTKDKLNLNGCDFQDLLTPAGLQKLDQRFLTQLQAFNPQWHTELLAYRQDHTVIPPERVSQLLIDCAVVLETFVTHLFDIGEEAARLQAQTLAHRPIFAFKTYYVLKHARRALIKPPENLNFFILNQIIINEIESKGFNCEDMPLAIANLGLAYLEDAQASHAQIELLIHWCIAALTTAEGRRHTAGWEMFHFPKHLNFTQLIDTQLAPDDEFGRLQGIAWRYREGFNLTDPGMSQRQVMAEVHYCVYCHENQGDFCSRGFPVKKSDKNKGFKENFAGETLTGCPLEEKISEMHVLKRDGFSIAALAMIMIDNPMCPATGHRICNDCMKSCIYQKQEPVDIPQVETRVLKDVLRLPWGVEIYDLLTRWNPLRSEQWIVKPYNGLKVLIMGMGPAGFSLAHHLLMEGFAVVGMDGLKIEPLPAHWLTQPICRYEDLIEPLADRLMAGFGGVAEYGITVRWDKNFLKLIYISLLRRQYFQIFGNIRLGGTLTIEDAWALGFDHVALAVGAGLPQELPIPGSLAPGMRQANDFLMALQLTGAAKLSSLANLQVRLPALVIGGGLTAVDTATEVQAYYLVQIEKMAGRYQAVIAQFGEKTVRSRFLPADLTILDEFLSHAQQLAAEREQAQREQRLPDLIGLVRRWGGVTIAYRRSMQESPAYRHNHEELAKALEEGIYYAEGLEPDAVILDSDGQAQALRCRQRVRDAAGRWMASEEERVLPARAILIATGARLNVAYEFEHRGTFLRQSRFEYRRYEQVHGHLRHVDASAHVKSPQFGPFTSYVQGHRTVTFLGDAHPVFHGSVVKAIASAKRVYPAIRQALVERLTVGVLEEYLQFRDQLKQLLLVTVTAVKRHNHRVVELIVRAPLAARKGGAGQFYRLQMYGQQMEGLPLLGVRPPETSDLLSFYVIEKDASSRLIQQLQPGSSLALMGPTGAHASRLPVGATVLVIGDILSPAFLLSMAENFRAEQCRVWYVGCYEQARDLYAQSEIEGIAERIIWLTGEGVIPARRPQDLSFQNSDVLQVLQQGWDLSAIGQIWVIGSSALLAAVQSARCSSLSSLWPQRVPVLASVYGPMQCMLKGVCAQCLQWQVDPVTGKRTKAVFACSWQHQPLERVDIHHLDERLVQNRCQETLTHWWLDNILDQTKVADC